MQIDQKVEVARAGVGAALVTVWGVTLNEWAAIIAILYGIIQIYILLPKAIHATKQHILQGLSWFKKSK